METKNHNLKFINNTLIANYRVHVYEEKSLSKNVLHITLFKINEDNGNVPILNISENENVLEIYMKAEKYISIWKLEMDQKLYDHDYTDSTNRLNLKVQDQVDLKWESELFLGEVRIVVESLK